MNRIDCLDRSLKLSKFIRADKTNHPIKLIQLYCVEDSGNKVVIQQGYAKISIFLSPVFLIAVKV